MVEVIEWAEEKPTEEGWYWYEYAELGRPVLIRVDYTHESLYMTCLDPDFEYDGCYISVTSAPGRFTRKLLPPKEKNDE